MKVVYIAHPVSGDVTGNIQKILKIVRDINLTKPDVVPFVPYLADLLAMDDNKSEERERGIDNDIAILTSGIINELWIYGPRISGGIQAEVDMAIVKDIPIVVMDRDTVIPPELRELIITGY